MSTTKLLFCLSCACLLALLSGPAARAEEADAADDLGPPPAAMPAGQGLPVPDDVPAPPADEAEPLPVEVVPADELAPTSGERLERAPSDPALCLPPCEPSCGTPSDECGRPLDWCGRPLGRWDVTLEATGTDLEDPDGTLGVRRPTSIRWGLHDYDPEFGGRLTIGYALGRKDRLELRGSWSGTWRDASTQIGVFGFAPPPGATSPVITATLRSRAELLGVEAAWWHELCCRGTWRLLGSLGYRYISFDESATFRAAAPIGGFAQPGFAHARVEHDMHLVQVAAAAEKRLGRRFEIGLAGKALLGIVNRDAVVRDSDIFGAGPHATRSDQADFGWGFDLELTVSYDLSARVALTAGYELLYLDAVVRADNAMDFRQAAFGTVWATQRTSSLLAHSVFAGLRVRF